MNARKRTPTADPAPLRLGVSGAMGRMGRAVLEAAARDPRFLVCAAWDRPGIPQAGHDAGVAVGLPALGIALGTAPVCAGLDLVVDFSSPEGALATLAAAQREARPPAVVVGATGMDEAQARQVRAAGARLRVVVASNFSVGMNLLWRALELVAGATGDDYDVEIVEAHHHHKKDSPSGTAMTTAEVLARALGRDLPTWARYGRPRGNIGPRDPREIGLHTVRGGDIVGDHTVLFAGPGERLELKHQAHSRENFARGALRAGRWLCAKGRRNGIYGMGEVLGLV